MLMLLCKDGATYEVLEEVLERLEKRNRKELVAIARFFAGKVFTSSADRKRLGRRFAMLRDFLKDSWTFQETLEEGREQGREQGRKQGLVQGQYQSIETVTRARFPGLLTLIKSQIASLTDQEQLQKILSVVSTANSEDELRQFLSALS